MFVMDRAVRVGFPFRADQGSVRFIGRMKRRPRPGPGPEDLLTIAEAAKLLGVSQPTLCRWDELGKFKARRHPINSYRMYLREDVLVLRKKIVEGSRAA